MNDEHFIGQFSSDLGYCFEPIIDFLRDGVDQVSKHVSNCFQRYYKKIYYKKRGYKLCKRF